MRFTLLSFLFLFLASCNWLGGAKEYEEEYTVFNSIEKDLTAYHLPFSIRLPIEDASIGNFKTQVSNEMDGYVWHIKKGPDFQLVIEELGDDDRIYRDKVAKLSSIEFFAKNIVRQDKDLLVIRIDKENADDTYYITRVFKINEIYFMISTVEDGVKANLYSKMLQTIISPT